jgi:transposase
LRTYVTSSYLEGTDNELAAFGYNRDGKHGKLQIVIGLLCDEQGWPLSVEVFAGNTADTSTFASQVRKVGARFGGGTVTLVGDRGMIKGPQIDMLEAAEGEFHYITAITKPQIESLLKTGQLQMQLFDEQLAEVTDAEDAVRYVLRRNPQRAAEVAAGRQNKVWAVEKLVSQQNAYLAEHPRASVAVAIGRVRKKIERLRLSACFCVSSVERTLTLPRDEAAWQELSKLDGCYCLKTDLKDAEATKELVHDRYKSLAEVEWAFRTSKSTLDVRPVYVRKESRTRGHVFVVMLAYQIVKELAACWRELDMTPSEGVRELASLCMTEVTIKNQTTINQVPVPRESVQQLLTAAGVDIPLALPYSGTKVYTKKKLPEERQRH